MACAPLTLSDTGDGSRQETMDTSVIITYGVPKMSAYARLKRYRERHSLKRERLYLAKDWEALGTEPRTWTARQCASRKRWCIYYDIRRQEREAGHKFPRRQPSHWVGPAERERNRAKLHCPTCNLVVVRHLLR
jgi:hypothetical protein